jgi:YebC/PmpR family DNA-binding regulatory protein
MSGHSHWSKVKWKKGLLDSKKSQAFSKIAREITVAAREGGGDPNFNAKLRLAIEKAKSIRLPAENIERAIKRGTGELAGDKLESVLFEAFGPGGIALIIEGITDNKNRTLGEIKQILNQYNGKLAGEGAVKWLFERKGCLTINPENQSPTKTKEELELIAIEAGAEDIYWHEKILDVYTKPEELEKVKKNLEEKGVKIDSASLDWVPKEEISLSEEEKTACQKLFEALDENDSVQEIYSNIELP